MILLFVILLGIVVLTSLVIVGLSKDNVFGLNEPPRIPVFLAQYGTIFPGHDNWFTVFVEDDRDLPREMKYEWEFSEGTFEFTEEPFTITYHAPSAGGEYYIFATVTVTDRQGASATATTRILVSDQGY